MSPVSTSVNMTATPPDFEAYLALGIYSGIALFLIAVLLLLSWGIGHKTRSRQKQEPYESGLLPVDNARLKGPVPFYLVAIFFIIFDVEVIFVASWAVAYDRLGWSGFAHVCFFIFILFLGLVHLWKTGGLEWGPRAQRDSRKAERSLP
ncbi:MAG: NAD(P)H-quinone oxidoreductase subunit 3 [Gammaproteobacteria bacterium]|nr:NAD(P)H-quinone oxidoreductase subunit 3 [Gammaproteobacteria bacterium]NIR92544.1 NAD(P)H-quinone oxidoreductase subunit 3 [Gammaproteobacteria bacterium]